MKKLLLTVPLLSLLAACGTTEKFEKRAEVERVRQEKHVSNTISKSPDWMKKLPESESAIYANGSGVSRDYSMAEEKAKLMAFSKVCTAAGGVVDKQSKMFMSDTEDTSVERSEMAIRSLCKTVDISGAEIVEVQRIAEGNRYRSFVLVALPIGEANPLQQRNDRLKSSANNKARAQKAFDELEDAINQR